MMEIEIRAELKNGKKLLDTLKKTKGIKFVGTYKEDDRYLKHGTDIERSLILRIRRKKDKSILTFKGKAKGKDTAWPDVDLPLSDPKTLEGLLLSNNYVDVVRIKKDRSMFKKGDFEINVDKIDNLGWFVEVEGRGNAKDRKKVETAIHALLADLGIEKGQIIEKGYVPLALERMAVAGK